MTKSSLVSTIATICFVAAYTWFIRSFAFTIEDYSDIIVGTTFFFTLFTGFFITRQNDRYSAITDQLTTNDGWFSSLYRITGQVPRIQARVRDIIRAHYMKILESKDLAYHVKHPSDSITRITAAISDITQQEKDIPSVSVSWSYLFEISAGLQLARKKILNLYGERLVLIQWLIVYVLALLLVVSFDFVPSSTALIDVLKICFGTAVFLSLMLLRQLDNLTLFGTAAGMSSVNDIMRIIDERDASELTVSKS